MSEELKKLSLALFQYGGTVVMAVLFIIYLHNDRKDRKEKELEEKEDKSKNEKLIMQFLKNCQSVIEILLNL